MEEPPRARPAARAALWGAALVLAAVSMELARFDHGLAEPFFWVAFVVAPVVLIFGAAAAGARRWYGWPDLGPAPGRAAGLAAAVVVGALLGSRLVPDDVDRTRARGLRLARQIRAWHAGPGGGASWPARLDDLAPLEDAARARGEPPTPRRTRQGVFPPAFAYDPGARTLSYRVGRRTEVLDVSTEGASWRAP